MARGIFAALEEEELVIEENNDEVEQLEADIETAEINEEQNDIDNDSETIEKAMDDIVELEEVSDVMEDSVEKEEGLDEDAAEMAQIAVEAICERLGYKSRKPIIPALESFGGTDTRLNATKAALEEVSDVIRKAWEAVKNFFRNIWESIKNFLARLFDANTKLGIRVKNVEEALDEAVSSGFVVKEGKGNIKIDKFAKAFNAKTSGELSKGISVILGNHIAATKEAAKVNRTISQIASTGLKAAADVGKATSGSWLKAVGISKGLSGLTQKTYVNGLTIQVNEKGGIDVVPSTTATAKGEAKVVPLAGLKGVVENVSDLQEAIAGSKADYEEAEKTVGNILKEMNKLSDNEDKERVTDAIKNLKAIQKIMIVANTKLPSLGFKAGNAALSYVNVNLSAYGAAK